MNSRFCTRVAQFLFSTLAFHRIPRFFPNHVKVRKELDVPSINTAQWVPIMSWKSSPRWSPSSPTALV